MAVQWRAHAHTHTHTLTRTPYRLAQQRVPCLLPFPCCTEHLATQSSVKVSLKRAGREVLALFLFPPSTYRLLGVYFCFFFSLFYFNRGVRLRRCRASQTNLGAVVSSPLTVSRGGVLLCVCMYGCVCVCVCICVWEGRTGTPATREEDERTMSELVTSVRTVFPPFHLVFFFFSLRTSQAAQIFIFFSGVCCPPFTSSLSFFLPLVRSLPIRTAN